MARNLGVLFVSRKKAMAFQSETRVSDPSLPSRARAYFLGIGE